MKYVSILIFNLLMCFSIDSQDIIDSIKNELIQTEDGLIKSELYIQLAEKYSQIDPKLSLSYIDSAKANRNFMESEFGLAKTLYFSGAAQMRLGKYEEAKELLLKGLSQYETIGDTNSIASSYYKLGDVERRLGNWDKAMRTFLKARELYHKVDKAINMANCDNAVGVVYKNLKLPEKAIESYERALNIYESKKYKDGISTCLLNIGNLSNQLGKYDKAILAFERSKVIANDVPNNANLMSFILSSLATAHFAKGNKSKALSMYEESYSLRKEVGKPDELKNSLINLAKVALDAKQVVKASNYIAEAEKIGLTSLLEKFNIIKIKDQIAIYHQDYQASHNWRGELLLLKDSLNADNIRKEVLDITSKYESEKKEQEIKLLSAKNEAQQSDLRASQNRNFGLLGGLGIASLFSLFLYRQREKIKSQNHIISKALEEKDVLLREIHHRVKNNLQFISSLLNLQSRHIDDKTALSALKEGQNRVKSMALIHQNLYQEDNLTGVEVRAYFEKLINNLFDSYNVSPERIQLSLNIEELNLDVDTVIPLGLVVNELVSNSLKHAFPEPNSGTVSVTLNELNEQLLLSVKDDGQGFSEEIEDLKTRSFGYKMIHAFADQLEATLSIKSDSGTSVSMTIKDYKKTN